MAKVPKEAKPTADKVVPPKAPPLSEVYTSHVTFGCDPEFFFKKGNRVVGSEVFLPKGGVVPKQTGRGYVGKFIIDGVQAELNPPATGCRANLMNNIASSFKGLHLMLKEKESPLTVCFDRKVTISKTNLLKLDPNNQKFGCTPSFSAYPDKGVVDPTAVNPLEYRVRAAGGHIHIGMGGRLTNNEQTINLVKLLDIIVGNTCVLIDRDKGNKERRKLYGRAGEYRLPPHGLEYRTPSNFWLHHGVVMSLVFGLVRLAVSIDAQSNEFTKIFLDSVSEDDIIRAINTNSYSLALKNYNKIKPLLKMVLPYRGEDYPFIKSTLDNFDIFHKNVNEHGLEFYFKDDPFDHWVKFTEGHDVKYGARAFFGSMANVEIKKLTLEKTD